MTVPLWQSSKMKRITEEKVKGGKLIKIRAYYNEDKQKMLNVWILAWTLCGLAIVSQVFIDGNDELRRMILIFSAFWAYFEYVVIKAWRWRKGGEEQIFISEEELQYGRTYFNRGILKPYRKDLLNPVRRVKEEKNKFVQTFADSYWVIGGEELAFTANGKVIHFGLRLTEKEANQVMKMVNRKLGEK